MCGFVGLVDKKNNQGKHTEFMNYALNDLHRRGPDSQLTWQSESLNVQFGFARLAIRDLSEAGNQPMESTSKRYTIVYNGETYNTTALCEWACIDTNSLKGHSDTEIILSCIEKKGVEQTIQKMDGIFAIALYDTINEVLYLIRDHAGVKPMYMGLNDNGVVFSSHYQHVTTHVFFNNETIDTNAIANYFKYGFIQEGEGILTNTFFLPHGHITTIDLKTMKWAWKPYFELNHNNKKQVSTQELKKSYTDIIASQLISDVPIGCFLSGGVDSTITTGIASELKKNSIAYTIGVDDKHLDESAEAKRFAAYFNVQHELHHVTTEDILHSIEAYTESMGEPLADYSSLVTLKVCELAKQKLTVVLSGDGGDELFWGYPRFKKAKEFEILLSLPKRLRTAKLFINKIKNKKVPLELLKYKNFNEYYLSKQGLPGNSIWVQKLLHLNKCIKKPYLYELALTKDIKNNLDRAKQFEYDIHMQRVLLKVDRASMYHSLEVRTPMLSKQFVEQSMHYSYSNCVNVKEGKLPLRELLQLLIPQNESNSGEKKGFSPPMATWMRNELKQIIKTRIENIPEKLMPIMKASYINELWQAHQEKKEDNSWTLWAIFSLFMWVDKKMVQHAH
jgi:asparagine synthase (glutamine-hydrolysing)